MHPIHRGRQVDYGQCLLLPDRKGNVMHLGVSMHYQELVVGIEVLQLDQTFFEKQMPTLPNSAKNNKEESFKASKKDNVISSDSEEESFRGTKKNNVIGSSEEETSRQTEKNYVIIPDSEEKISREVEKNNAIISDSEEDTFRETDENMSLDRKESIEPSYRTSKFNDACTSREVTQIILSSSEEETDDVIGVSDDELLSKTKPKVTQIILSSSEEDSDDIIEDSDGESVHKTKMKRPTLLEMFKKEPKIQSKIEPKTEPKIEVLSSEFFEVKYRGFFNLVDFTISIFTLFINFSH
uniref:Uncharacterized protein LOC114346079 n=1 Tax=Diabrotica virgifera virgifera TaxID=50390 RepID=A0A6P7H9U6_DIAVI